MTTDWRIYEMLAKADWKPGDEPPIRRKITITLGDRVIVVPLPRRVKTKFDDSSLEAHGSYKCCVENDCDCMEGVT